MWMDILKLESKGMFRKLSVGLPNVPGPISTAPTVIFGTFDQSRIKSAVNGVFTNRMFNG